MIYDNIFEFNRNTPNFDCFLYRPKYLFHWTSYYENFENMIDEYD